MGRSIAQPKPLMNQAIRPNGHSAQSPARPTALQVLARHWRVAVLVAGMPLVGALIYLLLATPLYTAVGRISVQKGGPRVMVESQYQPQGDERINFLHTERSVLLSTSVLAIALADPEIQGMKALSGLENVFEHLKKKLRVEIGRKDDIFTISYDAANPAEAAKLVNSIIGSDIAYQGKQRRTTAGELLKILTKERTDTDAQIARKSRAIVELKMKSGTLSFENRENPVVQALQKLADALTAARLEAIAAEAAYREAAASVGTDPDRLVQLERAEASGGIIIVSDAENVALRSAILAMEEKLADMQRYAMASHPQAVGIRAQLERLRAMYVVATKRRWAKAQLHQRQLEEAVEQQQKRVDGYAASAAEYAQRESELNRLERHSDLLEARIKELQAEEAAGGLNINLLEEARVPRRPSKPSMSRTLGMGLVLGVLAGIGAAYLREWKDPRLYSLMEAKAALGMPVLGLVPRMVGPQSEVQRGLEAHLCPLSEAAEAFRMIGTTLPFGEGEGRARTILIASPIQGEGKSTLASNLAIVLAQAGRRVLLVDADFRRPVQQRFFDVDGQVGLSNALLGEEEAERAIRATGIEGLELLCAGAVPANPSRAVNSRRLSDMLTELSGRYDQILVDSPALTEFSDARTVAAACDATLLVVRVGRTHRLMAERASEALLSVGAGLLGVVVNDVPVRQRRVAGRGAMLNGRAALARELGSLAG